MRKECFLGTLLMTFVFIMIFALSITLTIHLYDKYSDEALAIETIEKYFKGHSNHNLNLIKSTLHKRRKEVSIVYPQIKSWEVIEIVRISSDIDNAMYSSLVSPIKESFYDVRVYRVKHILKLNQGYNIFNSQIAELANSEGIWWFMVLVKDQKSDKWKIYNMGY